MDGKPENKKYYLMNKKIYSRRFSTDCFSDYFNDIAKKTNVGLVDYMEYVTEKQVWRNSKCRTVILSIHCTGIPTKRVLQDKSVLL